MLVSTGPTRKRRYLIPGSLPTKYMPSKIIETPKPLERKPPVRQLVILFIVIYIYIYMYHIPNLLVN